MATVIVREGHQKRLMYASEEQPELGFTWQYLLAAGYDLERQREIDDGDAGPSYIPLALARPYKPLSSFTAPVPIAWLWGSQSPAERAKVMREQHKSHRHQAVHPPLDARIIDGRTKEDRDGHSIHASSILRCGGDEGSKEDC